jgi:peptidylprolyl isomerase
MMTLSRALLAGLSPFDRVRPWRRPRRAKPAETDWRTPAPETVMVIDTNKGRVFLELSPRSRPATWRASRT